MAWPQAQQLPCVASNFAARRWLGAYAASELARVAAQAAQAGVAPAAGALAPARQHRPNLEQDAAATQ